MNNLIDYKPNYTFVNMMKQNFIWGLAGIVLGVIINIIISSRIFNIGGNYKSELKLVFQLMICSAALAFIHVNVNNEFGWTWQNVTPGLFFVSYFFGTQFATFSNIQQMNDKAYLLFNAVDETL